MRKYLHIILIATMLLSSAAVWSQSNNDMRQVYAEAESAYQLGQLEQAINILEKNLYSFQGNTKQNALRLLSLCHLALDNFEESERYASMLLDINPYYTSTMDPMRFEDMVNLLSLVAALPLPRLQVKQRVSTRHLCLLLLLPVR